MKIGNSRDEDEAFFRVALRHTRLRPGFAHSCARARTSLLRMHTSSAAPRCRARHANHDRAAGPRLDSLPVDVLLEVTKPLGGADLLRCAAVSRGWRDALEPAFESRCVSRGREDRAWLFPATGSIDGGETLRASDESRTWRERFQDAFCVWCREAPRAPVTLVAEPWRCAVVRGWTKLATRACAAAFRRGRASTEQSDVVRKVLGANRRERLDANLRHEAERSAERRRERARKIKIIARCLQKKELRRDEGRLKGVASETRDDRSRERCRVPAMDS